MAVVLVGASLSILEEISFFFPQPNCPDSMILEEPVDQLLG